MLGPGSVTNKRCGLVEVSVYLLEEVCSGLKSLWIFPSPLKFFGLCEVNLLVQPGFRETAGPHWEKREGSRPR